MPLLLAILLTVNLAVVGIWDVIAIYCDRHDFTVSFILFEWSQQAPTLLLWIGMVLGHCFLPLKLAGK